MRLKVCERRIRTGLVLTILAAHAEGARAQTVPTSAPAPTTPAPATPAPAPAAPAHWWDAITYGIQGDVGFTGNPDRPSDGVNFGRLFDDKSNTVLLNAIQLTAQKALNSGATGYDWGFIAQAEYGTDARYTHFLGEFNDLTDSRYQLSLLQANVQMHAPWLSAGGIDFKLGQFSTPIGYETIDPSTNPFYSHSYNFNFGPFEHTGLQAIWHLDKTIDIWGQIDTGENTTFGSGDNNAEPAGLVGLGLNNLAGGKLTVLWLTHMGPENATNAVGDEANSAMRYESDVVLTYKATDKLTFVNETQWQHDDIAGADSYGTAGYVSYALSGSVTANFRGEVYRDNAGFFVAAYPGTLDPVRVANGLSSTEYGAGRQTYSEWTLGLTYKPTIPHVALLAFRPEIRWDKDLSGGHPFNDLTGNGSFTLAGDIVLGFAP